VPIWRERERGREGETARSVNSPASEKHALVLIDDEIEKTALLLEPDDAD
jgi:hypothetical protein